MCMYILVLIFALMHSMFFSGNKLIQFKIFLKTSTWDMSAIANLGSWKWKSRSKTRRRTMGWFHEMFVASCAAAHCDPSTLENFCTPSELVVGADSGDDNVHSMPEILLPGRSALEIQIQSEGLPFVMPPLVSCLLYIVIADIKKTLLPTCRAKDLRVV